MGAQHNGSLRPTVIINGPSAGGTGKTQNTVTLGGLLRLSGHEVLLVDADPTTRGLESKLPHDAVKFGSSGRDPEEECDALLEAAKGKTFVLIDSGAAALQQPALLDALTLAVEAFTLAEFRCVLTLSLISNKGGLERDIGRFKRIFGRAAEVFAFLTASAGRAGFDRYASVLQDVPLINVPKLSPALVELSAWNGSPLDTIVTAPPPGFASAAAILAHHLARIADQAATAQLVGAGLPVQRLLELASARPMHWLSEVDNIDRLQDRHLEADAAYLKALGDINRLEHSTSDGDVLNAARRLIAARLARIAV